MRRVSLMRPRPLVLGCALIWSVIPIGCARTTGTGGTEAVSVPVASVPTPSTRPTACGAFPALSWSSRDTDATIREVKAHNAARRAVCE